MSSSPLRKRGPPLRADRQLQRLYWSLAEFARLMSSIDYIAKCKLYRRYRIFADGCYTVAFVAAVAMSVWIHDGCDSAACVLVVLLATTLIGGVMFYTSALACCGAQTWKERSGNRPNHPSGFVSAHSLLRLWRSRRVWRRDF